MKWIKEPIANTSYSEILLAINKTELEILQPVFERALEEYRRKCEKYEDIRQSGEATERQLNLWTKYSEIVGKLECLVKMLEF